ncbi:MAG: oligosaccharide flippase family protein [Thermodesulfovibrionales bacterium]
MENLLQKRRDKILRNIIYVSLSFIATNIFGYVFHAIVSRKLGPPLYAEFSVLYAFMIALSRPVNILSWAIARVGVTGRIAGIDYGKVKKFSIRLGLTVAFIIGLFPILFSPLISKFLKTDNMFLFFPIALTLFLWSISGILRGLFTSIESFGILSYSVSIELFVRAICGIILVLLEFQVLGALIGSAVGALSMFVVLYSKRKHIYETYITRKQEGIAEEGFGNITTKVFFISVPTGFFLELDLLLAKRFFSPEEAGIFAATALIGKALLMFSIVASTVIYPKLVEEKLSKKGISAFLTGVLITIFLFTSGYVFFKFFEKPVILLLFGNKYAGVIGLVPLYILALVPLALHLQVTNYKGAIGGWTEGIWLWIVLGGYYCALEIYSSSFTSYFYAIFLFHAITAPLSAVILYFRHKVKPHEDIDIKQA